MVDFGRHFYVFLFQPFWAGLGGGGGCGGGGGNLEKANERSINFDCFLAVGEEFE